MFGEIKSITAGIEDRGRSDSPDSFTSVAPTIARVRLVQTIPVLIEIDYIPDGVQLTASRTTNGFG